MDEPVVVVEIVGGQLHRAYSNEPVRIIVLDDDITPGLGVFAIDGQNWAVDIDARNVMPAETQLVVDALA